MGYARPKSVYKLEMGWVLRTQLIQRAPPMSPSLKRGPSRGSRWPNWPLLVLECLIGLLVDKCSGPALWSATRHPNVVLWELQTLIRIWPPVVDRRGSQVLLLNGC